MSWLPLLVLAGLVLNGLRLRRRAARLATLVPTGDAVRLQHRFVTAAGVELDADTRRAASAHADLHRLDVLDLVPADLPSGPAFDLLRMVNPAKYRTNRLAPGRGALHALLVDVGVAERAGITRCDGLDAVEMVELTIRLKRHASVTADRAVAPGLRARPDMPAQRLAVLRAVYDTASRIVLALPVLLWAALVAGAVVNPRWGLAAAGAFVLQPYLVFAGTSLKPRDLHRTALLRPVTDPLRWWKTVTGAWRPAPKPDPYAALKQAYAAEIGAGTDRFFEERRASCPWCGSGDLSVLLRYGRPRPGQARDVHAGAVRCVPARVPEPAAVDRRARLLLPRLLRRARRGADRGAVRHGVDGVQGPRGDGAAVHDTPVAGSTSAAATATSATSPATSGRTPSSTRST